MKPRNVAVVQARMGSSRFPGKMLAPLDGKPLLEWVLRRVARASLLAGVVLATSDDARDDALATVATRLGIAVFRGSESDVLGRFVGAARAFDADNVIRVCADNPWVDPGEVDRLAAYFVGTECDYACNHQDRLGSRYADGFGAEMLSAVLLEEISNRATEQRHREHVTLYLWDHEQDYRLRAIPAPDELARPDLRFDVDRPEDLAYLEGLAATGIDFETPARDIVRAALAGHRAASTDFSSANKTIGRTS